MGGLWEVSLEALSPLSNQFLFSALTQGRFCATDIEPVKESFLLSVHIPKVKEVLHQGPRMRVGRGQLEHYFALVRRERLVNRSPLVQGQIFLDLFKLGD